MQNGIEPPHIRRRKAELDTVFAVIWELAAGLAVLWVRAEYVSGGVLRVILLIIAICDIAAIIPTLVVRHQRIKEILGGEEDEASQY